MGRAPCCDKANVKKGPWSPEEDAKLKSYIEQHGTGGNWIALPQKIGLKRCGKSCRLRWLNYLRPNIRHGGFSEEEDNIICSLYISIGSRWSVIAAQLPGRTDNDIKNYWNTRLKKKLLGKQRKEQQARRGSCLKQEMKRGSGNAMVSDNDQNLNPYWPELPPPAGIIPYPKEELSINDHSSIRRLLIRLGGRFSDEEQPLHNVANLQLPIDVSSIQQPYDQSVNFLSSPHMNTALNNPRSEFDQNSEYNLEGGGGGGLHMLHGQNSFLAELEEMVCSNPQRLDGLEFLYPQDMINHKPGSAGYGESRSWGETSSMPYHHHPVTSDYEAIQHQRMAQDNVFNEELRYPTQQ